MIKRILIIVGIAVLLGLIVLWLIQGGASAVAKTARSFVNPLSLFSGTGSGGTISLPWQPAELTRGPDITDYVNEADQQAGASSDGSVPDSRTAQIQSFGTPSPYVGAIRLSRGAPGESDPAQEYIALNAGSGLSSPVTVSGWSLQSAVSGKRAIIPEGATTFVLGVVNNVYPVTFSAGSSAIITTGTSPVGVSFEENMCDGYLSELRSFTPALSDECPAPSDSLPMTATNIQKYGSVCFDYVASLDRCHFPGASLPASLPSTCQSFVVNTYSYNGCVDEYRAQTSFKFPTWRLFLNHTSELWSNTHDVIRLLDSQGRTVDVLSY